MPMNWTSPQRIFLGITLATVLTQPLLAETLSVCTEGGCDFSSIQAAIDAAEDGDVIEIVAESCAEEHYQRECKRTMRM